MVRFIKSVPIEQYYGNEAKRYVEIACLSGDTKPTAGIATGSLAHEVDTGKVYAFNETGTEWILQFSFQG